MSVSYSHMFRFVRYEALRVGEPLDLIRSSAAPSSANGIAPTTGSPFPRQSEINVRFNIDTSPVVKRRHNAKRYDDILHEQEFITDIVVGSESNKDTLRVKVGGAFRPSRQSRPTEDPWITFYDNLTTREKDYGDLVESFNNLSFGQLGSAVLGHKEEDYVEIPVSIAYTNKSVQRTDFLRETELTSVLRVLRTESHIDVRIYIDATVMEVEESCA